jgi:cytosolic prostaglandin-E synthase
LHFKGVSEGKEYAVNVEFFKAVDSSGSTYKVLPRSVQMFLKKKTDKLSDDKDEEFWPRLLLDKAKEKNQVKIDWDRYVDQDEEEGGFDMSNLEGGSGMGGMPGMGGMGGMPGMGGMGGMDMEALMAQMGGMGGGGGMGGMDDGDDDDDDDDDDEGDEGGQDAGDGDDDDLPDLEE